MIDQLIFEKEQLLVQLSEIYDKIKSYSDGFDYVICVNTSAYEPAHLEYYSNSITAKEKYYEYWGECDYVSIWTNNIELVKCEAEDDEESQIFYMEEFIFRGERKMLCKETKQFIPWYPSEL